MIRPIGEPDVDACIALRQEALLDAPLTFAASPDQDYGSDPDSVRARIREAPDSVILGAFDQRLVGIVSLFRERHRKFAHKANVYGMYVTASHRRRGHARELLAAAIRHAESLPGIAAIHLSVSSAAPGARRLYEAAGFRPWGEEPDSLRHEGQSASELHMVFQLSSETTRR